MKGDNLAQITLISDDEVDYEAQTYDPASGDGSPRDSILINQRSVFNNIKSEHGPNHSESILNTKMKAFERNLSSYPNEAIEESSKIYETHHSNGASPDKEDHKMNLLKRVISASSTLSKSGKARK